MSDDQVNQVNVEDEQSAEEVEVSANNGVNPILLSNALTNPITSSLFAVTQTETGSIAVDAGVRDTLWFGGWLTGQGGNIGAAIGDVAVELVDDVDVSALGRGEFGEFFSGFDFIDPLDRWRRSDLNLSGPASEWSRETLGNVITDAVGAGGIREATTHELIDEWIDQKLQQNPDFFEDLSEDGRLASGMRWAVDQGYNEDLFGVNISSDYGQTWRAISTADQIAQGVGVAVPIIAGIVVTGGSSAVIRGAAQGVAVGTRTLGAARFVMTADKTMFIASGIAITPEVVASIASETGPAQDLIETLLDSDSLSSRRGINEIQGILNDTNRPFYNQVFEGTGESMFIDRTGVLDEETYRALNDAAGLIVNIREHYQNSNTTSGQEVYQDLLRLEERFHAIAEQYVNDPMNFNPTEADMITMQLWMAGNGFDFGGENVRWGLAGKEWTLDYLDTHFERFPAQREALLRDGTRRSFADASRTQNAPDSEEATFNIRSSEEREADMSASQERIEGFARDWAEQERATLLMGPKI